MPKYIALLRAINVGGKNIIKMTDLKNCFEQNGFKNISTFIQSGNVIFDSTETNTKKLEDQLEIILSKTFNYTSTVLIRNNEQIKKILDEVPSDWAKRHDLRCYIAFVKEPATPEQIAKEIYLKKNIDFLKTRPGVLYMTILLDGITQSSFSRLASKKIYQSITIRNYTTTLKIARLMNPSILDA